jgi:hypothetical protein
MCASCVSSTEVIAGQAALAFAVLREPVHRLLADAGVVAPIDPVKRDVRTVAFLRSLDLDPVDILGAGTVAAADAWSPSVHERVRFVLRWRSGGLVAAR